MNSQKDPQSRPAQPRHYEVADKLYNELVEMSVEEQVEVLATVHSRLSQYYEDTRSHLLDEASLFENKHKYLNEALKQ